MKTFLDLLAIDQQLVVEVNGKITSAKLTDTLKFFVDDFVKIDGIEILPCYRHLCKNNQLIINEPFYCWYHQVSGQGWLLKPQ